jgi:hypothetical protein
LRRAADSVFDRVVQFDYDLTNIDGDDIHDVDIRIRFSCLRRAHEFCDRPDSFQDVYDRVDMYVDCPGADVYCGMVLDRSCIAAIESDAAAPFDIDSGI